MGRPNPWFPWPRSRNGFHDVRSSGTSFCIPDTLHINRMLFIARLVRLSRFFCFIVIRDWSGHSKIVSFAGLLLTLLVL
jgi:hypothetical protein